MTFDFRNPLDEHSRKKIWMICQKLKHIDFIHTIFHNKTFFIFCFNNNGKHNCVLSLPIFPHSLISPKCFFLFMFIIISGYIIGCECGFYTATFMFCYCWRLYVILWVSGFLVNISTFKTWWCMLLFTFFA